MYAAHRVVEVLLASRVRLAAKEHQYVSCSSADGISNHTELYYMYM